MSIEVTRNTDVSLPKELPKELRTSRENVCASVNTKLGTLVVSWCGPIVTALEFAASPSEGNCCRVSTKFGADGQGWDGCSSNRLARQQTELLDRLAAYAEGHAESFHDVPLDLTDRSRFQRAVLEACRQVPWGQTRTYSQLAHAVGSPKAARAVGSVMASNRVPLIIPCHRVVGSAPGQLGGFSAPGGIRTKKRLLELENNRLRCPTYPST